MSDMSEFEQWALNNGYCYRDLVKTQEGKYSQPIAIHGYKAFCGAKQSMQGEALATIETYWSPDAGWQYNLKLNKQFDSDKFCEEFESKGKVNLFTHAPDSAARIAEQDAEIARLQNELEEARKVPDGYALVPVEPTAKMLDAGSQCWMMTDANSAGYWSAMIEATKND